MDYRIIIVGLVATLGLTGCVTSQQLQQASVQQFEQMRAQIPISRNAADRAFVTCVSNAIIAELEPPYSGYAWDVEVFADEAVNAFAMPGGKIGVFDGIFQAATNQNELAAVIGHEVAHVTRDHSLERANREFGVGAAISIGAGVLGVDPTVTDGIGILAEYGLLRPYGRGQESEADLVGLTYMARAGFDPRSSIQLWQNMAAIGGAAPPEWMSTHPSSDTRISSLNAELARAVPIYESARAQGKRPNCRR
jgi:predicted Zn-dependent protease